ncbi:MAG: fumarylacetoacetate hydrolase family protein, partial [Roseiflexaceae bacterium]
MRFVSFNYIDRFPRAGVLLGASVIDLSAAAALVYEGQEGQRWELLDILRGAPEGMGLDGAIDIASAVLDQLGFDSADDFGPSEAGDGGRGHSMSVPISIGGVEMLLPLDEVRLVAPLPRPPSL